MDGADLQPLGFVAALTQGFLPQRAKALVGDPVRPGLGYGRAVGAKQEQWRIATADSLREWKTRKATAKATADSCGMTNKKSKRWVARWG